MSDIEDDLVIDQILTKTERKKGIKSGSKGKRVELQLAKMLTARFKKTFSRSVGSGNRWGQVTVLPKHAQDTFSGDLVCPENFRFVIECKGGYNQIDFHSMFVGGCTDMDLFLQQADDEAARCARRPLLAWKKDRRPWLVAIHPEDLPRVSDFQYRMVYRDWLIIALDDLLKLEDSFFFDKIK